MSHESEPYKILIVDDIPNNLRLLSTTLSKQGYKVRCAKNGAIALMGARNDIPDLILLDINMPDLDGYQVCQQLKADPTTKNIPIIFLSAQDDVRDKVKAFTLGGADFIGKPFQVEEVLIRVRNQIALQVANAKIVTLNESLEQRVRQRTSEIESANQVLKQEIYQRRQLEEKLRHDALHDSLTGLPNRNFLMKRVEHCLDNAIEHQVQFAVLFIDLDRFKIINDSLGHLAGDELLIACAARLKKCTCDNNTTIARLGGDEFTVLLEQIESVDDAITVAENILQEFSLPFELGDRSLSVTVSIGIAVGNSKYTAEIELLRDADTAMYRAKELGKSRYEIFTQQMYLDVMRRLELEHELLEAISNQELILHYQPIFCLQTQNIVGFEALVRWQHPLQGIISPGEFIPLAEETGMVVPLGQWVLYEACRQLQQWQEQLPAAQNLTMSINVAGEQLHDPNFLSIIDRVITTTRVNPNQLKLEIVESMLIEDTEQMIAILRQIKTRQIELSIDDFGTGYSSLSYLPQFPVDIIKIDRSFINAMNLAPQNSEIVKTIIALGQILNLQIVAEGIETTEQNLTLQALNVEFGQGFLFSRPLTAEQARASIVNQTKAHSLVND